MKSKGVSLAVFLVFFASPIFAQEGAVVKAVEESGVAKAAFAKAAAWWTAKVAVAGTVAYFALSPGDVQTRLESNVPKLLDNDKDKLFHSVYLFGTAKSVKVLEIDPHWKTDDPQSERDLDSYDVTYVIYWEGPIEKDGYVKLVSHYDAGIERFTGNKILDHNGITKDEALDDIGSTLDTIAKIEDVLKPLTSGDSGNF